MYKSFLRQAPIGPRLPQVSTRPHFAAIACCALLSVPINARVVGLTSHTKIAQEGLKSSDAQHSSDSDRQDSMKLLRRLAKEQVVADVKFLGKTRFSIDQQSKTFFYDLSPMPLNVVLSDRDPYARPLEALIRVESLRRDFGSTIPNETFWSASLDSVERAIQHCVQDLESLQPAQDAGRNPQECSRGLEQQFDKLKTSISTYASGHRLEFTEPLQTRDPVIGYRVHIKIDPPKARVRVMTLLEYKKFLYFQTPKEKYQWSDLLTSDNDMIGWYHYRAEWPAELNGPEEGDFEIKKPGTITFKPNLK